jgi:hypothetical protein
MGQSEYMEIHHYDHPESQGTGCAMVIAKYALILLLIIFGIGIVMGVVITSIAAGFLV